MRTTRGIQLAVALALAAFLVWAVPAAGQDDSLPGSADGKASTTIPATPLDITHTEKLIQAQNMAAPILARYKQADAGTSWDDVSGTLTFRLVPGRDGASAREALASLELPVRVAFSEGPRSTIALAKAAQALADGRSSWAAGLPGFGYIAPDPARGALILGVLDRYVDRWRVAVEASYFDVPVLVRGEQHVGVIFQSEVGEISPRQTRE